MSALFNLGRTAPTGTSSPKTFWVGIDPNQSIQNHGKMVLMRECQTLDELKATVEQMKHELDAVVAQATFDELNGS